MNSCVCVYIYIYMLSSWLNETIVYHICYDSCLSVSFSCIFTVIRRIAPTKYILRKPVQLRLYTNNRPKFKRKVDNVGHTFLHKKTRQREVLRKGMFWILWRHIRPDFHCALLPSATRFRQDQQITNLRRPTNGWRTIILISCDTQQVVTKFARNKSPENLQPVERSTNFYKYIFFMNSTKTVAAKIIRELIHGRLIRTYQSFRSNFEAVINRFWKRLNWLRSDSQRNIFRNCTDIVSK